MSNDEEDEQQQQQQQQQEDDAEDKDYSSIFKFYFQFTKPLVLELPSSEDRALAAAWVQKLETGVDTDEENKLRVEYLKLLLFVLQRGNLIGMFKSEPPEGSLEPFPEGMGLPEMCDFLLEQVDVRGSGDADGTGVPYSVEISNDLKEFVAAQEIPNFGVQVYFAYSMDDPIHKWSSFEESKFPYFVQDKIRQLKLINSEEKTSLECPPREMVEGSPRKSCGQSSYDKTKPKVKSPQEIERSQERSYQTYVNLSEQRGNMKDKCGEEDRNWSKKMKCGKKTPENSCQASSMKLEEGAAKMDPGMRCAKVMSCSSGTKGDDEEVDCEGSDVTNERSRPVGGCCRAPREKSGGQRGTCKCGSQLKNESDPGKRQQFNLQ